jgi:hypothetical protein
MSKLEEKRKAWQRMQAENVWNEHPDWSRKEWGQEAFENNTNLGYWDWVWHQIESNHEK